MTIHDTRRPAYGPGRVLILIYGVFALSATARAAFQLIRHMEVAPLAYWLSALAGLVYIVATVGLAHNGRRMRVVAWVAVGVELIGVIGVGLLSILRPEFFAEASVWSHFGSGYGYVPLILPFLGLWWLWYSSPTRLARNAQ